MNGTRMPQAVRAAQRGQSLVEVLVVAAAMLSAFFAVPLLAKYQDIRHAAIAAARTAGFECSVRPDACGDTAMQAAVAEDLRRRHFARHDHDLLTADGMADDAPAEERNRFWVDRRGASLLSRHSDVQVAVGIGRSDAARGGGSQLAAGASAFGLDLADGMVTARMQAGVSRDRTLAQWLQRPDGMSLALSGKAAVMVDAWNASSGKGDEARSFQSRVERGRQLPSLAAAGASLGAAIDAAPFVMPGSADGAGPEETIDLLYAPVRELITGALLRPLEPRGRLFRYHEIDVEIVPEDRVGQP